MRPTLSELGEYDGTALMEFKTKKDIIYRINYDTVCTYEMDDTPPFQMNDQALDIAIEISMLLNANLVDEIHIARKQYLDGSIPTGFQRTAIVSVGGSIPYKDRQIDIIQLSIEEDSCRESSDVGHKRVYLTDRLGMPLIETVTYPQMRTPQEVADVNQILRRLVRSSGKVRVGIGAGREDVNVSVTGGTRIEIKGVPRIVKIPLLTYNEAQRQWNLLRLREELHSRGITQDTFIGKHVDVTKLLKKTWFRPISEAIEKNWKVNCVTLKGFKDLLRWQTQTDTYFSREISDRVRVIACLTTLPNIIHSDNPSETLTSAEWQNLKKFVGATEDDTIVLTWGDEMDVETAAKEIIIRAKEATIGIPSETRQALRDGTNGFERILPGPERMYPDTDLPPKQITQERIDNIRAGLPRKFWEYDNWYTELGLDKQLTKKLSSSIYAPVFEKAVKELGISPIFAAVVLNQYTKRLGKRRLDTFVLTPQTMLQIFESISKGMITKDGVLSFLELVIRNNGYTEDILPKPFDSGLLELEFRTAIDELNKIQLINPENKYQLIMGIMMKRLRGRIEGKKVADFVKTRNY